MSIEAMKLALAALETCRIRSVSEWSVEDITPKNVTAAIEALRTAIQQAEARHPATPEPGAWSERELLRHAQAAVVMPMIGPLLDAWENSDREVMSQEPELSKQLKNINSAMEGADTHPAQNVPDEKPLPDLMMASYHEAIGWNACRAAMLAAKGAP